MRTNIVIDDKLMRDTLRATGIKTKREAVDQGLRTLLRLSRQAGIRRLRGKLDWQGDLQDQLTRDYINAEKFAALCSKAGIGSDTPVVFYGDKSNWWACYAFWAFKLFGHPDCRILNGGRKLWFDPVSYTHLDVYKRQTF